MKEYLEKLRVLLGDAVLITIGGNNWVINITPSGTLPPPRCKKLIGIQPKKNSTVISLPRNGFGDCGVGIKDTFFDGSVFRKNKSYMLLSIDRRIEAAEIAPVISQWLNHYIKVVN